MARVKRLWISSVFLALATSVPVKADNIAENWWQGIWAYDAEWCSVADRIGSVTPAPILISDTEMAGYENTCSITQAQQLDRLDAVQLHMTCQSEGSTLDTAWVLMAGDDGSIWIWQGYGTPDLFHRCEASGS